ncbi:MAG TPA: hypothetical protein VHG08_17650 [Longimicrobium sp.]|nr:hypothetical protein [Longimicrobium sp.]
MQVPLSPLQMLFRFQRRALAASAALLLLAACDDGPTGPTSYVQHAAGGVWVAVAEPAALPRVETWLPYVGEGQAAATLREMRDRAARARSAGRVEEAMALEDEMMRFAAVSLSRAPEPARLLAAAAALDQWVERSRARLALGSYPELAASTLRVGAQADSARGALARDDAAGAVQHLTRGTLAAREHAPVAVGLRLMAAVEARLAGGAEESAGVRRARHLLADAREGLATGDSVRALRRAVYALQLLDAEGIAVPAPTPGTVDPRQPLQ